MAKNGTMGKNEAAWAKLFETHGILSEVDNKGFYEIAADTIKVFREPRLMTKFDHKTNLPEIFKKNNLSILPNSSNSYIIARFEAYRDFEDVAPIIKKVSFPQHIESIGPNIIPSEAIALNLAVAAGIMEDFLEDENLFATVSGKMGTGDFMFGINDLVTCETRKINVRGSRMEIDAAYEGKKFLSLIEAKINLADDFLVRQLYYPFRVWHDRVQKKVKSVFMIYSDGVFHLWEYRFIDPGHYNSLRLAKRVDYIIVTGIIMQDIEGILRKVVVLPEPRIPFPQADKLDRVVNLLELLKISSMTSEEITENYAFDKRQTSYYTNAGIYLGLIDKKTDEDRNVVYSLSAKGEAIMVMDNKARKLALVEEICRHEVFKKTLEEALSMGGLPDKKVIVDIMHGCEVYNVEGESTYERRASTVKGWTKWILDLIED